MLGVKNLFKRYGNKIALEDINFQIKKGEVFVFLGPSGSGKTTLLRILNFLDCQSGGKIFFNDEDTGELSRLKLRRKMAMVFQGCPLFNSSVYDNIAYGIKVREKKKEEIERRVKDALNLVKLHGYENRNANTLSGGEAQKVALAMATIVEPEVLLLDEPTANLDPINIGTVKDIIKKIKNIGITVIIATHKQDEAIEIADRIAVLNNGKIEQIGSPDEIFRKPSTEFVANFTDTKNIFNGVIKYVDSEEKMVIIATRHFDIEAPNKGFNEGKKVKVCIRPEEVMILREDRPINRKHKNILRCKIIEIYPHGSSMYRLNVKINKDCNLFVDTPRHATVIMDLKKGKEIKISLKSSACHIID